MTLKRLLTFSGAVLLAALELASCDSTPGSDGTDMQQAVPAPILTQVSQPGAANTGGAMLTLTGQNFQTGATVTIGGVAATNVTVVSGTQITCTVPAKPGVCAAAAITVKNPDGQSVTSDTLFAFRPGASFAAVATLATGMTPRQVITPDLDGDGNADLVTVNSGSGDLSIRFGAGDGTFGSITTVSVGGGSPFAVAVADITGDSKVDLVTAHSNASAIKVVKATTTARTYMAPTAAETFSAGAGPYGVALAAIDNTNGIDAVVVNNGSSNVSFLSNNGTGTFAAQTTTAVESQPTAIALGRFVNDKYDYAVVNKNGNSVTVRLNNGSSGFSTTAVTLPGLKGPTGLVIGDWDGDQKTDLAVANSSDGTIQLIKGSGTGTFTNGTALNVGAGASTRTIATGDFNRDGKPDLAVANEATGDVSVLLNLGDGTFASQVLFPVGATPGSISIADLNKDGLDDLITTDRGTNNVTVRLNNACTPPS